MDAPLCCIVEGTVTFNCSTSQWKVCRFDCTVKRVEKIPGPEGGHAKGRGMAKCGLYCLDIVPHPQLKSHRMSRSLSLLFTCC